MDSAGIEFRQRVPYRQQDHDGDREHANRPQSEQMYNDVKSLGEVQRSYQILKKLHLNLSMMLLILPTGGAAVSSSPAFHVKLVPWHKPFLPPSMKIYAGAITRQWTKLPESAKSALLAEMSYKGVSGLRTIECTIRHQDVGGRVMNIQSVKRIGWRRKYRAHVEGGIFTTGDQQRPQAKLISAQELLWKGAKMAIQRARAQRSSGHADGVEQESEVVAAGPVASVGRVGEPYQLACGWHAAAV